jgi:hypothetical protein
VERLPPEDCQKAKLQTLEAIKQDVSVGKFDVVGHSSTDSPHTPQPTKDDNCNCNLNPFRGGPHLNLPAYQRQNTIQNARQPRTFNRRPTPVHAVVWILKAKSRETVPVQSVDATPYNQLICQCFSSRINQYGSIQSEPKQGFCFA